MTVEVVQNSEIINFERVHAEQAIRELQVEERGKVRRNPATLQSFCYATVPAVGCLGGVKAMKCCMS